MANDSTEWQVTPEIVTPAASGIINAIIAALPAVTGGVNPNREAAYNEAMEHAIELRRLLANFDPTIDAAVQTALTATLNTL